MDAASLAGARPAELVGQACRVADPVGRAVGSADRAAAEEPREQAGPLPGPAATRPRPADILLGEVDVADQQRIGVQLFSTAAP